ncbi:hypothetical protein [Pelotalea chapellei]|uniref:Uncharacterized protein n=1 Tax=Pelotalea chapellei TaxID=44671 RepID=A0ABS5U4R5_9BACT|nr:hypothetical protein [Pelotalea chapellei]MBT1070670.1 hypothetical protein [Pelotalea chapellei]
MIEKAYDIIPATIDVQAKLVIPSKILNTLINSKRPKQLILTRYIMPMQGYDSKVRCIRLFLPHKYRKFEHDIKASSSLTEEQMAAMTRSIFHSATRHHVSHTGEIKIQLHLSAYANLSGDVWFIRDERGIYLVSRPEPSLITELT